MNIVVYLHHEEGHPGPSIEAQKTACHNYATAQGHTIIKEYTDYSGAGICTSNAFNQLLGDGQKNLFQGVLIYSGHQLSNNILEYVSQIAGLEKIGAKMFFAKEPHSVLASVLIIEKIILNYEEYRSKEHSEKVKRGIQLAKARKAAQRAEMPSGISEQSATGLQHQSGCRIPRSFFRPTLSAERFRSQSS